MTTRSLMSLLVGIVIPLVFGTACQTATVLVPRGTLQPGDVVGKLPSGSKQVVVNDTVYYQNGSQFFVLREGRFVAVASPHSPLAEKQAILSPPGRFTATGLPNAY